jgi:hypothetical protein
MMLGWHPTADSDWYAIIAPTKAGAIWFDFAGRPFAAMSICTEISLPSFIPTVISGAPCFGSLLERVMEAVTL